MLDSLHMLRRALFAAALICAGPFTTTFFCATAHAQVVDPLCRRASAPEPRPRAHSLRDKVSRFAPRLRIYLWFEPRFDDQHRARARTDALSEAPAQSPEPPPSPGPARPLRRYAKAREPFGWHVTLRWDLAEMAEAANPRLFDPGEQPLPTACLESGDLARRLLLENTDDVDSHDIESDDTELED